MQAVDRSEMPQLLSGQVLRQRAPRRLLAFRPPSRLPRRPGKGDVEVGNDAQRRQLDHMAAEPVESAGADERRCPLCRAPRVQIHDLFAGRLIHPMS